jgi:kynurenine formamidase
MRIIDMTLPLYNGVPAHAYGTSVFKDHPLFPYPFKMEAAATYEANNDEYFIYTMAPEPGTRVVLASGTFKDDPTLDLLDLKRLVLRETVVLDIPKKASEVITAEDLENAFKKSPVKKGDALFIRTGWGDNESYAKLGLDYKYKSPRFNDETQAKLTELLKKAQSDMFVLDTSEISDPEKFGPGAGWLWRKGIIIVGGLVNGGEIKTPRVKLTILPLKIRGGHSSPARVMAIEE